MKILFLSCSPLCIDLNIGNTFLNIFKNFSDAEFASIYLKSGDPGQSFIGTHFQMTEKDLLKNLKNPHCPVGHYVENSDNAHQMTLKESAVYDFMRKNRLMIFFWCRDLIWSCGHWKSKELKCFLDDFQPDIIFTSFIDTNYLNKIILYVKKYTSAKLITFAMDNNYSLLPLSFSPLFWATRLFCRGKMKRIANKSDIMYVASDIQKQEYEKWFHRECKVLTKGYCFGESAPIKDNFNTPIKLLFTGNVSSGRWRSLAAIGRSLSKINSNGIKAQLYIYTMTPMKANIKKALTIPDSIFLMGGVSADKIPSIQQDADILVHVESMQLKERLEVHQSFSTKIVDYFVAARCIFSVGTEDEASIDYLIRHDAAVVALNKTDINDKLQLLINNPLIISEYAQKAWNCGKQNHQADVIQNDLYKDFKELLKDNQS